MSSPPHNCYYLTSSGSDVFLEQHFYMQIWQANLQKTAKNIIQLQIKKTKTTKKWVPVKTTILHSTHRWIAPWQDVIRTEARKNLSGRIAKDPSIINVPNYLHIKSRHILPKKKAKLLLCVMHRGSSGSRTIDQSDILRAARNKQTLKRHQTLWKSYEGKWGELETHAKTNQRATISLMTSELSRT